MDSAGSSDAGISEDSGSVVTVGSGVSGVGGRDVVFEATAGGEICRCLAKTKALPIPTPAKRAMVAAAFQIVADGFDPDRAGDGLSPEIRGEGVGGVVVGDPLACSSAIAMLSSWMSGSASI